MDQTKNTPSLGRLANIVAQLRAPQGCPWDAAQTPESLRPCIIEEAYELIEAIDQGDHLAICEELGDLLLQVVLLARIFEERHLFSLEDVARGIADKLERRHPHVFGDCQAHDIASTQRQWDEIKRLEKRDRGEPASALGTFPPHLPALMKARKLTERASRAGFDWPDMEGVMAKVHEELAECEEAFRGGDGQKMEEELGDLLFAAANLGRFLDIDAENALGNTIKRFTRRFHHVEHCLRKNRRPLTSASLKELQSLWEDAKQRERGISET
jgi:MazG family protein